MGRIVINKTENGQTVILNDTAQEVNGGYFDKEMKWHDFGGGGDSQFVHVTINVNGSTTLSLDNVLQDNTGLVTEYPSAFDPDVEWYIGSYNVPTQNPPFQVEALAMKNILFIQVDASALESYKGTVKHVLRGGDIIFYADEDGQTLELTLKE